MKPVSADALLRIPAWQCERLRDRRLRMVKGGIEASNVRQRRHNPQHCSNGRHIVGLVQWSQRHEIFQRRERSFVDEHRLRELCATVDDAMSGRANMVLTEDAIAAPGKKKFNGPRVTEPSAGLPPFFPDHPGLRACNEVRLGQQTLELPPQQLSRPLLVEENRKFETRGTGIQNEKRIRHEFLHPPR